jgi:hypothetical protein
MLYGIFQSLNLGNIKPKIEHLKTVFAKKMNIFEKKVSKPDFEASL